MFIAVAATAAVPTPEAHFGHRMGADRALVEWDDVVSYFTRLAGESDRVEVSELGKTTEGRPFLLVTVADAATLQDLERYRQIQSQLVDPRITTREQAEALAATGKAVVLITCSIHSTEVASTHTAIEFVHRLITQDTPRHRAILAGTIFLLVPSLNPDGVDKVAAWYKRYLGTLYEGAPMTELYQKYTGHDNNRDWYMFTQAETRLAVEKIHNVWHPQVVYDVHQMGSSGARIFVPPWTDPIDPNIDALLMQQANLMGVGMAVDLTATGKKGVVINGIYDHFTPARHYQSYHGGMRLLSESASVRYATPVNVPFSSLESEARGYNARESSWNFLEPWPGGRWTLRDIVDYQLIAFESCLYQAATRREDLLRNFYRISERVISRESPWAYHIPKAQHDPNAMTRLLETLSFGEVEITKVLGDHKTPGRSFREGDYLIRIAQPFGSFAKTLLENQNYPDLRLYPGGPPRRPYDVTAHTLPLLLGVDAVAVEEAVDDLDLAPAGAITPAAGSIAESAVLAFSPAFSHAWKAVNRLMKEDIPVYRDRRYGTFYVANQGPASALLGRLSTELGLQFTASEADLPAQRRLRTSRVGLYQGHVPIMDEGWTRWVLDQYEFPYESVDNARLQEGGLSGEFDVIILPDARPSTLHAGYIPGALYNGAPAPPEYTGGLGNEGAEALRQFLESGGTVLAFNQASSYAIDRLQPGVRDVLANVGNDRFYGPGSLLNARVDITHPLCFGMSPRHAVWFESGPVFEMPQAGSQAGNTVSARSVLTYPQTGILASGWLLGEKFLAGRSAVMDVSVGRGHLVLFGIRPQYRAQSNATFKLLFNGLYYWEP
ncbi:MAG: M14 metallopeptidase family protein [Bryobacterales bacterium]